MAVITIPKVLRDKLGEDGADSIIELINLANQQVKEDVIEVSGEKFERRLTEEMSELKSNDLVRIDKRITEEVAKLDKRITEEIGRLRSEDLPKLDKRITDEIAKLKSDDLAKLRLEIKENTVTLIKWQVGMFVTTVILILGLYATIIFK